MTVTAKVNCKHVFFSEIIEVFIWFETSKTVNMNVSIWSDKIHLKR